MSAIIETRAARGLEIRKGAGASKGPGTLVGYAAVFDRPSDVLTDPRSKRAFREVIRPGAFARSIRGADVRALHDHDSGKVLGRSTAGTLRMTEDKIGLRVEIDLPDTQAGRDTAVSVARGDLTGMSFGFCVEPDGDSWDLAADPALRHLKAVRIDEVSIVAWPAYPDTTVALRSLDRALSAVPAAVRREHERDRDLLKLLRAR